MKTNWTKITVVALLAILVIAAGAVAVFAQDEPVPDAPPVPRMPFGHDNYHGGFHGRSHGRGGCTGANDEDFAEALGVTPEELQAAREKLEAQRLAEAVEAGILTQEQVDNMLAMRALKGYLDREALLAQALGLDPAAIEEAREAGTLRELLADAMANITPTDLQANMQQALEEAINAAVADGVVDADQAALILEQMENGFGRRGNFGGGHPGYGGRRSFPGSPWGQENGEAFAPFRSAPAFDA